MNIKSLTRLFIIFLFANVLLVDAQLFAQSNASSQQESNTIIEELNSRQPNQGNVTVYQDEAIKGILAKSAPTNLPIYTSGDGSVRYVKMRGYKIQVFSGNDQRKSKDEAYYKQKLINDSFDDIETVVYFQSPRWILRAGNFRTRAEANVVMEKFRDQFPNFGKEMYIIADTVKIPH